MQMLLRIPLSLLLLPITAAQVSGSASSSASDTMSTALRNTLLLPLKQIHDALEPLQQMRDDLSILASRGFHDSSHLTEIDCPTGSTVLANDCSQLYDGGYTETGVYTVYISNAGQAIPISVFCDMETDGGGWLVFQRRQDGSVNFYRGWKAYTEGFGNITGEYWLGNELLHLLTGRKPQQLRVDLHDHEGHTAFAKYEHFYVGPPTSKFLMTVSGYTGTAGDSMANLNNQMFSTKDQDNDTYERNCASRYNGAWWYKACHYSNLNGMYAQTGSHNMTEHAKYVNWFHWRGYKYSLKFTELKIRPEDH